MNYIGDLEIRFENGSFGARQLTGYSFDDVQRQAEDLVRKLVECSKDDSKFARVVGHTIKVKEVFANV